MINNNKPNVIWLMFDSLRNEFLNEFGCEEAERNFVDELVSHGVSFTNCHGTAPFTIVSMASKMTGCYPSLNHLDGWLKKDPTKTLNPLCLSFPEILRYNGYFTCYMSASDACTYVNPQGFDYYHAEMGYEHFDFSHYINHEGPKFVYIDFGELHDYCCKKSYDCTKKDFLDGIKMTVSYIKEFYEKIKTGNDMVILTSDHGMRTNQDFKGSKYSKESVTGRYLTEATTHNSFNLIWKGHLKPQKINDMCRGVDIMPTVLDILGLEYPLLDGVSLKPLLEEGKVNIPYSYSLTGWSMTHPKSPGVWCVRDHQYKLVIEEHIEGLRKYITKELFDYVNDKEEATDLANVLPDKFKELDEQATAMFFTERSIMDFYNAQKFDINKYLKYREEHLNKEALAVAANIIKFKWQKGCRRNFLIGYYKFKLGSIIYWQMPWLYKVMTKLGKGKNTRF